MTNNEQIDISEKPLEETQYITREEYSRLFEAGKPAVEIWKSKFEEYVKENQHKINWFFEKAAMLYGGTKPSGMKVSLIYNPNKGNTKGEPVDNFSDIEPGLKERTDIVYWVPDPEDYLINPNLMEHHIKGLLHEGEHGFFQGSEGNIDGNDFDTFIGIIDHDPEIVELREKLFGTDTGYLEPTKELLTVYLENILDIAPQDNNVSITTLEINSDENTSFSVLLAAMYYQERDYKDAPTTKGPYANLRRGYRAFAAQVLQRDLTNTQTQTVNEATGGAISGEIKISPYDFKDMLSPELLQEYINLDKQIDKDFIIRLYQQALVYAENK